MQNKKEEIKNRFSNGQPSANLSLDLVPDPFIILRTDGTIYDLNTQCARLAAKEKKTLMGKHFAEIGPLKMLEVKITDSLRTGVEDFELIVFENKHFELFILPFQTADNITLVRLILKDISNFVNLERELLKRNRELIIINTLSGAFISSENMDLVIENILKKVLLVTDFTIGMIFMKEEGAFRLKSSRGISADLQRSVREGVMDQLCSEAIKEKAPLHIVESALLLKNVPLLREGVVFLAAVPLADENDVTGLLFLASRIEREKYFDFDFASLISLLGNHISLIISKLRLFQETRRLSITDGLTGLYNTRFLYKQLDLEIARTNRYGSPFSLILFDIDDFKKLNDTYGHQAGDEVLHDTSAILQNVSRDTDVVVRYGGEEFIIILPNTSEEDTIFLADRIRKAVQDSTFLPGRAAAARITVSGGIASYPKNADDARSLLNAADRSLYAAKASGKNMVLCFKGMIYGKDIH